MKVSSKDVQVLFVVIGILALVISYLLVYRPYTDKTAVLDDENASLALQLTDLQNLSARQDEMKTAIETDNAETEKVKELFDAGHIREDEIMYVANAQATGSNAMSVDYINMTSPENIEFDVTAASLDKAVVTDPSDTQGIGAMAPQSVSTISLVKCPVDFGYEITYDGIKNLIDYLNSVGKRKKLDNLTLTYNDTTGNLSGTATMDMYYLSGTDGEYQSLSIPAVQTGVEDVFGTIDTEIGTETAADTAAANGE